MAGLSLKKWDGSSLSDNIVAGRIDLFITFRCMFIASDDLYFLLDHLTIGLVRPNVSLVGFIEGDVNITGSVRDMLRVLRNLSGSVNLCRRQQVQQMINRILRHHSHSNF